MARGPSLTDGLKYLTNCQDLCHFRRLAQFMLLYITETLNNIIIIQKFKQL